MVLLRQRPLLSSDIQRRFEIILTRVGRYFLLGIQIESIEADTQIKTEREWKDLIFYKSQLYRTTSP